MKIKALKTFVSGIYTAEKGETITVPEVKAAKIVRYGLAELVGDTSRAPKSAQNSREKSAGGETPIPAKKTAKSAKSGVKK